MSYLDKAKLLDWLDSELQAAELKLSSPVDVNADPTDRDERPFVAGVKATLLEVKAKVQGLTF